MIAIPKNKLPTLIIGLSLTVLRRHRVNAEDPFEP